MQHMLSSLIWSHACLAASSVVPIISLVNDSSLMPATLPPRDSISDGIDSVEHSTLLIGIDPGTTGAVATLLLDHATANRSVAQQLEAALVSVFDMPVTETPVHKRTRRCADGFWKPSARPIVVTILSS